MLIDNTLCDAEEPEVDENSVNTRKMTNKTRVFIFWKEYNFVVPFLDWYNSSVKCGW